MERNRGLHFTFRLFVPVVGACVGVSGGVGGLISRFFSTQTSFSRSLSLLSAQTGWYRIFPVVYFQHRHIFPFSLHSFLFIGMVPNHPLYSLLVTNCGQHEETCEVIGLCWCKMVHTRPALPSARMCMCPPWHTPTCRHGGRLPSCLVHRAHASPVRKCISHPKSLATFCPTPCCCTHPASDSCVQQANCAMQQAAAPWQSVQANRFSSSIASFYRNISAHPPSGCQSCTQMPAS